MTILLDPAHGGIDSGSRIGDNILEKDITLALAFKLRSLLAARGFTVVLTRDADATPPNAAGQPLTLDDRAGLANHIHPSACILLHATGAGTGVHLYTSELDPTDTVPAITPWLLAQSPWVPQSRLLAKSFATALTKTGVPLVTSAASVRPVDSLTCPALVLELAPQSDDPDTIRYADYQQQVAQAIAGALVFWPNQLQPPTRSLPPGGQP
jgi:N-acetylmuramoyl-L-alanine amidase